MERYGVMIIPPRRSKAGPRKVRCSLGRRKVPTV
jgi:hypothetical protein